MKNRFNLKYQIIAFVFFVVSLLVSLYLVSLNQDIRRRAATPTGTATVSLSPSTGASFNVSQNQSEILLYLTLGSQSMDGVQLILTATGVIPNNLGFVPETIGGLRLISNKVERSSLQTKLTVSYITTDPKVTFSNSQQILIGRLKFTPTNQGTFSVSFDQTLSKIMRSSDRADILRFPNTYVYTVTNPNATATATARATATAQATATATSVATATPTTPSGTGITEGVGLVGRYFNMINFQNLAMTRVDRQINFNWRWGSPSWRIWPNTFSIEWKGYIKAPETGEYTFYTFSDDGVKVSIDNKTIIDHWTDHKLTEMSGKTTLEKDKKYPIVIRYYENREIAVLRLLWQAPNGVKELVPQRVLFIK